MPSLSDLWSAWWNKSNNKVPTTPEAPTASSSTPQHPIAVAAAQDMTSHHLPIYAENRRTHAPMYIGNFQDPGSKTLGDPNLGRGFTASEPTDGLTTKERTGLLTAGIQNHVGAAMEKFLYQKSGQQGPWIFVNPTLGSPTDTVNTIKHETVHSVLDKAGLTDHDYTMFLKGNPNTRDAEDTFNRGDAMGDVGAELPAYAAQPSSNVPMSPNARSSYLDSFNEFLNKRYPQVAGQYQSLITPQQ